MRGGNINLHVRILHISIDTRIESFSFAQHNSPGNNGKSCYLNVSRCFSRLDLKEVAHLSYTIYGPERINGRQMRVLFTQSLYSVRDTTIHSGMKKRHKNYLMKRLKCLSSPESNARAFNLIFLCHQKVTSDRCKLCLPLLSI